MDENSQKGYWIVEMVTDGERSLVIHKRERADGNGWEMKYFAVGYLPVRFNMPGLGVLELPTRNRIEAPINASSVDDAFAKFEVTIRAFVEQIAKAVQEQAQKQSRIVVAHGRPPAANGGAFRGPGG